MRLAMATDVGCRIEPRESACDSEGLRKKACDGRRDVGESSNLVSADARVAVSC